MAKKNNAAAAATESKGSGSVFVFSGIFLLVAGALFMFVLYTSFARTTKVYDETVETIERVNSVNSELLTSNNKLLMLIVNTTASPANITNDIRSSFTNINNELLRYEKIVNKSSEEMRRYKQAKAFIDAYEDKANETLENMFSLINTDISSTNRRDKYIQEIYPLQVTAAEMFSSTIDIANKDAEEKLEAVRRAFMTAEGIILGIIILGEIAIIVIARVAKRNREALARQAAEIEAATQKFKHTKEKASEMAYTNILTGMKNRYALDNDLSGRLETDQFNIAVFDMDNFRSINDMYGYDFGDEYLAMLAERLKEEYGNDAEIYNITGNEFCFVFNKDVSDIQATKIAERVIQTLGEWYTVLNLNVQLTASGSTCHYLPGDSISVSALLVKLDNVLRDAKRNGGNAVYQVMGI